VTVHFVTHTETAPNNVNCYSIFFTSIKKHSTRIP
jgi:hypothetical protein